MDAEEMDAAAAAAELNILGGLAWAFGNVLPTTGYFGAQATLESTGGARAAAKKAAPLANLRGGPCVVPAGITYSVCCGFL